MAYYLLLLILFVNVGMEVKNIKDETSFGLNIFGFKFNLDKIFYNNVKPQGFKLESVKKSLDNAVLWKNAFFKILTKTKIKSLHIRSYYLIDGNISDAFKYVMNMNYINAIKNTLRYYCYSIKNENYENIFTNDKEFDIDFRCIFKISFGNIIIIGLMILIKYIGGKNGKPSRRNA